MFESLSTVHATESLAKQVTEVVKCVVIVNKKGRNKTNESTRQKSVLSTKIHLVAYKPIPSICAPKTELFNYCKSNCSRILL